MSGQGMRGLAGAKGQAHDAWLNDVAPEHRPTMPGGPYTFPVPRSLKLAYVFCAVNIALLGAMGEYLYAYNVNQIAGEFGLTTTQGAWASAAYYGFGASNALMVIKGRIQFGTRRMFFVMMSLYLTGSLLVLVHPSFATLVIGRACNGMAYSMALAKAVYYMLVVVPADRRFYAPMTALGTLLMSSTVAGLVPIDLLTRDSALGFRLICVAIPCYLMMLALLFPLTPTDRVKVFGRGDILTIAMAVPAILMIAGGLSQGAAYWWTQVPWIGWLLACGIALLTITLVREHRRKRPMLHIEWMTEAPFLTLVFVVLFERIGLAEQSAGVRGLFASMGYDSDQLHGLQFAILFGQLAGLGILASIFKPERAPWIMFAAMLITAGAAWADGSLSGAIAPSDIAFTQALVGGASIAFVICGLLFSIGRVVASGPHNLLSMIVLYAFTQNMGGLIGSALVRSYHTVLATQIQTDMAGWLPDSAPQIAANPEGVAGAAAQVARAASVLAYFDTFRFVAMLAVCGAVGLLARRGYLSWREARTANKAGS